MFAFYSHTHHQGTIYPATAHVVPFVVAFAAGPECAGDDLLQLVALIANIAASSSWTTEDGCRSGSVGEGVADSTRQALGFCKPRLRAIAARATRLAPLLAAVEALVQTDVPTQDQIVAVNGLIDELDGE